MKKTILLSLAAVALCGTLSAVAPLQIAENVGGTYKFTADNLDVNLKLHTKAEAQRFFNITLTDRLLAFITRSDKKGELKKLHETISPLIISIKNNGPQTAFIPTNNLVSGADEAHVNGQEIAKLFPDTYKSMFVPSATSMTVLCGLATPVIAACGAVSFLLGQDGLNHLNCNKPQSSFVSSSNSQNKTNPNYARQVAEWNAEFKFANTLAITIPGIAAVTTLLAAFASYSWLHANSTKAKLTCPAMLFNTQTRRSSVAQTIDGNYVVPAGMTLIRTLFVDRTKLANQTTWLAHQQILGDAKNASTDTASATPATVIETPATVETPEVIEESSEAARPAFEAACPVCQVPLALDVKLISAH